MAESLGKFSEKPRAWNRDTFGNVFKRKKRLSLRLEGVQRALAEHTSRAMLKLERNLRDELKEMLLQEEMIWRQRARTEWLRCGDNNTKFFHMSTLIIRKRNRIEVLQDDHEAWIEDVGKLKGQAIRFCRHPIFPTG